MAPHAREDLYEILGVSRSASTDEIKAAYRKLALEHHPDRAHSMNKKTPSQKRQSDEYILKINAAYDTLSDTNARIKYDLDRFGDSANPLYQSRMQDNYKGMTAEDVDNMFSGLNTYERFTTAQYHAKRSIRAPTSVGRRRTDFAERKNLRASKLPAQNASVAWLGFPIVLLALWGFNLSAIKKKATETRNV